MSYVIKTTYKWSLQYSYSGLKKDSSKQVWS